jgi:hypothetical protein
MLALRLVTGPVMAAGLLSVLLSGASMFGAVLPLPLWFQIRLGEGAASTGLHLMPLGLGTLAVMLITDQLTDHYGGGVIALVGSLVVLGSTVPFPWLSVHPLIPLVHALLVLRGGGLRLSMMPAMTAAYASVRPGDLGDATTLANITMRMGGALGAAPCVIALSHNLDATGPPAEFTSAFLTLTVICVLATLAAAWLRRNELQQHPTPTAIPSF